MNYVIATSRVWYEPLAKNLSKKTGSNFNLINSKEGLTMPLLNKFKPRYIFFPHWSYIIPKEIFTSFECIVFHMTDLPFGRGGSPLQNLIGRGIYETKISAIRCEEKIDCGPVYLKVPFSLYGTAEEIYLRAAKEIEQMIVEIASKEIKPVAQKGTPVIFKRRQPEEGELTKLKNILQVFDYIRMLDADGYPPAFLKTKDFRLEFHRPALKNGKILADVEITSSKGKN